MIVYPRVCGGNVTGCPLGQRAHGLSPRVRGNRDSCRGSAGAGRSIPACAGEPTPKSGFHLPCGVYPRVCGGTPGSVKSRCSLTGLSPRVRGNLQQEPLLVVGDGSIPACAGEPRLRPWPCPQRPVYPRVCGGNPSSQDSQASKCGLSPRVRGKPAINPRYH